MWYDTKAYRTTEGTREAEQLGIDPPELEAHPITFRLDRVISYSPNSNAEDETNVVLPELGEFTIVDAYETFDEVMSEARCGTGLSRTINGERLATAFRNYRHQDTEE